MEVVAPLPDFHFNNPATPSTSPPRNSGFDFHHHHRHISAPNSPTSAAAIYAFLRETAENNRGSSQSSFPFDWEHPKSHQDEKDVNFDFDFDFSNGFSGRHLPNSDPTADELFELGMIRPQKLKLPPRLYTPVMGEQSPKSPRERGGGLLSPLRRGRNQCRKELDPFSVAMAEATRSRKDSRSLSPFRNRGGDFYTPKSSPPRISPTMAKGGRGWKLKLKGFFLFRSSSEGRAAGEGKVNDLCKNGSLSSSSTQSSSPSSLAKRSDAKKGLDGGGYAGEESRCSSFRSTESGSSRQAAVAPDCVEDMEAELKKNVMPARQSKFSIRGIAGGKFAGTFIRRRS